MFDAIYADPDLFAITRQHCRENDVGATVSDQLLDEHGHLQHDRVLVLKLDALYSSQNMHNPPPAPDYLVIVRCGDDSYEGYIIELRDTGQTGVVRSKQILPKFRTAVDDFLSNRYRHIFFNNGDVAFKTLKLYLVTDPLGLRSKGLSEAEYKSRIRGTVLDAYSSLEPVVVGRRAYLIEPVLPDPTVQPC
ncbi:MAG: hypothetical protein ACK6DW_05685 [Betaproteobacteria bacterium]|jgi:hypothetical protein